MPYIDDINVIGTSASGVNSARDKAAADFAKASLPTQPSKNVDAGTSDYSIAIGLAWWRDGAVTVKPSHGNKLFSSTNRVVVYKQASPRDIQRIVGLWNWALLLHRPVFSVLFHVYAFMLEPDQDRRRRLPDSVVMELSILLDLFPLLFAKLSRPLSTRVYASDASEQGAGLVYVDLSQSALWRFKADIAEARCRKGWYATLQFGAECDSEFVSTTAESVRRKIKFSKRYEKAILSQTFKMAVKPR